MGKSTSSLIVSHFIWAETPSNEKYPATAFQTQTINQYI